MHFHIIYMHVCMCINIEVGENVWILCRYVLFAAIILIYYR